MRSAWTFTFAHFTIETYAKPRPERIPQSVKEGVRADYDTGDFTKKQLSTKYDIKYNSIVNILRKKP